MKRSIVVVAIAFLTLSAVPLGVLAAQGVSPNGPAISPFRGMKLVRDALHVQVDDDTWFVLDAIAGVDGKHLVAESHRLCGESWWKRLTEDLPALLDAIGTPVGDTVDLKLRSVAGGDVITRKNVPMTADNRRLLWQANRGGTGPDGTEALLSLDQVDVDLAQLRELIDTRYAYRALRDVDLDAKFAAARKRLRSATDGVDRATFAGEVDTILRALGDGHSRLRVRAPESTDGFLPFLVQRVDGGHAAFRADRSGLVDAAHPFVEAIDSVPLERWLAAARARSTQGSATMVERDAERGLRMLGSLRQTLRLPSAAKVKVTLRGAAGTREVELDVAARAPIYGEWPRSSTRRLDGDIGYLRIPRMESDAAFLARLDAAMASFADTRGLVIDVRGNGGGSRDALLRLFPYLLAEADGPQVVNVAAVLRATVRAETLERGDALADRYLRPADWSGFDAAQRAAIERFVATFEPEWTPPADAFSPWHFLVLDRRTNPRAYTYAKPVVVLIDDGCFSATDIFVAALRTRPNVKLVGTATSGGSGRAQGYRLDRSRVELQLSSMASFRPDGKLFEGNGVSPDVVCPPAPGDLVGDSDTQLARAIELCRGK